MTIKRYNDNLTFPFNKANLIGGYCLIEWDAMKNGDYEETMQEIDVMTNRLDEYYHNDGLDISIRHINPYKSTHLTSVRWARQPNPIELQKLLKN